MTRKQTAALAALIAELDAGVEWPDALFLISCEHNIGADRLRDLYDHAARMDSTHSVSMERRA